MSESPYGANPFEAPQVPSRTAQINPGILDPIAALSAGWEATKRNVLPWIGIVIVGYLLTVIATMTIVGIFIVGPVLLWGGVLFTLRALDGEAEFGDLFAGFSRFGEALGGMLGFMALMVVAMLPGYAVMFATLPLTMSGEGSPALSAVATLSTYAWFFLINLRLNYAPYFIVDQSMGPVEAMKASWEMTKPQKLNNFLLFLLFIPVMIAGALCLLVGLIPAMLVMYGAMAAAYRQLTGRDSSARSAF